MEFLKYGDCFLDLQNLGKTKLMLELFVMSAYKSAWKNNPWGWNIHICQVQIVSASEQAVFPKSVETWIYFPVPLRQLWARPWAEWNTEKFKLIFLPYRSSWSRIKNNTYTNNVWGTMWSTFVGELHAVLLRTEEKDHFCVRPFSKFIFFVVGMGWGIRNCWADSIWERVGFS